MNPAKPGKLGSWTQLTWVTCSLGSHGLAGFWTQLKPRFNLGWTQLSIPGVTFTSWSTPFFGMLLSKLSNKNAHMSTSSIRMISFFNVQCELFTSCNLSNNLSLVSPQGSGGGGGQPNVDRYGQGGQEVQKFPNLCRHPLCMTPMTAQKKMLVVQ